MLVLAPESEKREIPESWVANDADGPYPILVSIPQDGDEYKETERTFLRTVQRPVSIIKVTSCTCIPLSCRGLIQTAE